MPLRDRIAGGECLGHALPDMIPEDLLLHGVQGGADRGDLGQNFNAVAVVRDHPYEAAHLALDPLQPGSHRPLGFATHGRTP